MSVPVLYRTLFRAVHRQVLQDYGLIVHLPVQLSRCVAARWTAYPDSVRCWLESSPATWTPRTRGHIIGGVGVFCEKLKQARLDAGLTQRQAAERAGIAVSQWQDYETGRRVPLVTVAAKLARAVGASLDGLTSTC